MSLSTQALGSAGGGSHGYKDAEWVWLLTNSGAPTTENSHREDKELLSQGLVSRFELCG